MLTILHKDELENIISKGEDEVRIIVYPNFINKFSLFLAGSTNKGVEVIGVGPMAMRSYWSLLEYAQIVGLALEKGYRVFIRKDGSILEVGDWYIEFKLFAA